jgi:hypothetical protein
VNLGDIQGVTAKDTKLPTDPPSGTQPAEAAPTDPAAQPEGVVPNQTTQPIPPQSLNDSVVDETLTVATVAQLAALATRPGRILWGVGV